MIEYLDDAIHACSLGDYAKLFQVPELPDPVTAWEIVTAFDMEECVAPVE